MGLGMAVAVLGRAGCQTVYLDGSFTTDTERPRDFDACWDPQGVDPALLDPVLLEFSNRRAAQKARYAGEMFPSSMPADASGIPFVEFFQRNKNGQARGIVRIRLGGSA